MSASGYKKEYEDGHAAHRKKRQTVTATWDPELRRHDPFDVLSKAMKGRLKSLLPLKA